MPPVDFRKPLKVFVCYSHADAQLCSAFRSHLKTLADDGLVDIWHDGTITAGQRWDDVIRKKLESADLFVALTSADFNSSRYIEGVEVKRARERHQDGSCRMIPVMARKWRPPKWLRDLQFLPSLDRDVAGAAKPDDVWVEIVEGIERAAEEMAAGNWSPNP